METLALPSQLPLVVASSRGKSSLGTSVGGSQHPRASLWLLVLGTAVLLGLGTQPVWGIEDNSLLPTGINEEALVTILMHVKKGMSSYSQFAVATLLSRTACQQPAIAEQEGAVIQTRLLDIWEKGTLDQAAYVNENNLLVAIVNRGEHTAWHTEAVLVGTMDKGQYWGNPLEVFLANNRQRYPPDNSCFIFFSLISPCLDYCLNPDSDTYIVSELNRSLHDFNRSFQAFAFEHAYEKDKPKGKTQVWEAWRQIPMPLFRCFSYPPASCTRCNGTLNNECFHEILLSDNELNPQSSPSLQQQEQRNRGGKGPIQSHTEVSG